MEKLKISHCIFSKTFHINVIPDFINIDKLKKTTVRFSFTILSFINNEEIGKNQLYSF